MAQEDEIIFCSWNVGGDPVNGCWNRPEVDDLCEEHHKLYTKLIAAFL